MDESLASLVKERIAHITLGKDGKFELMFENLSEKEIEFLKRESIKYVRKKKRDGLLSPVQMIFRAMELGKIERVSLVFESRGFTRFANCLARMVKRGEM